MQGNVRIYIYENTSFMGGHMKKAIVCEYEGTRIGCHRLLICEGREGVCMFLYGSGSHIRGTVRKAFKDDLGSENPPFADAFAYCAARAHEKRDDLSVNKVFQ